MRRSDSFVFVGKVLVMPIIGEMGQFGAESLLCLKGVNGTHLGPGLTECSEIVLDNRH